MNQKLTFIRQGIVKHLFDFFMLFLAVSLGFVVDNYRDEFRSEQTALVLAGDLKADLVADSIEIQTMLHQCGRKMNKLDTLMNLIHQTSSPRNDTQLYYYSAFGNLRPWFERHSSTYVLMMSTGNLSNFTQEASAAITRYYIEIQETVALLEQERGILNSKIFPFQQQHFQIENFHSITHENKFLSRPVMHRWDDESRWLYHNYVNEMKTQNLHIAEQYQTLLTSGSACLTILNKEYDLH
ncbi:MAG: hypothetical protein JNJ58_03385 [Chitinophagaceae bacterium]|nr:hypothetical protein [Chitinophagaceae bacterium]